MPSPAEPFASGGAVRESIDFQRFPWIRPLVAEYHTSFARVSSLFAGDPARDTAWREAIRRATEAPRDRASLVRALATQLERRQAPVEARDAAARLQRPEAVAVVTGQQAGLFGGPLYTVLKAVTTIQLARRTARTYGIDVVPVFWVDTEDHDWNEVRETRVLDRDSAIRDIVAADPAGAGHQPVARLALDDRIEDTLEQLAADLPPSEFSAELVSGLKRRYRSGASPGSAFAGWMDDLLGRFGLVVFEADDPACKPLAADLFARELETRATAALARRAGAAMAALGHPPQVEPAEDAVALFYLDAAGRTAIRWRDGAFSIGDATRSPDELIAEAANHPERFSPNVLLRPLVQDRLFPTVCYVAGPSELAYHAQLGGAYDTFGVPAPLVYPRASATLVDSAAARFLERSGLPIESLQPRDDASLNRFLASQLPEGVEQAIQDLETTLTAGLAGIRRAIVPVDATLGGVADTTLGRMRDTLKTLQSKIVQAAKRKDDTLRRQFFRTRSLVFPEGTPQERAFGIVVFLNRYGPALPERLLEALPLETDKHYILAL